MGRYIGPKARINRSLSALIYENHGAARAQERRNHPPGMHTRQRRNPSLYGLALREKQKLKHYFGLGERQLRRTLQAAQRQPGDTGVALLLLCERRLDNVVRRAGFTRTRPQARQGIVHGHFRVNGIKVDKPSYLVQAGDVIAVQNRPRLQAYYRDLTADQQPQEVPWLNLDPSQLQATVVAAPSAEDVSLPIEISRVVELQ